MATTYNFAIKTADQFLAGTDSNIFIRLYGAEGISPEIRLNAHISGNAFERDTLEECSVELDDDCGDIYMIEVRSDLLWAGADWLCDYFTVQRGEGAVVKFQLPSAQWIEDRAVHRYQATAGYNYNLPKHRTEWRTVPGATHYIPANLSMDKEVKAVLSIDVNTSEVSVINTSTQVGVEVGIDAIKAAFEFQIDASINKQLDNMLHQSQEFSTTVHIPEMDRDRTLQEMWSVCDCIFEAQLGEDTYNFRVPEQKVFSGFKEVDSLWPEEYSVD